MGFTLPSFWRATTPPTTAQLNEQRALDATATLELEGAQDPQSKTIASGSISPTVAYVIVDTEGSAAADDLNVINPVLSGSENLHTGMIVNLKAADSGRVVTVKNSGSANGINTYDGNDYVLSTTHWLKLQLRSGKWYEVEGRAMETALAAVTAAANASTAADHATTKTGTSSTASGTAAKVVTCSGFELSTNARIFVTFSNANTVTDAITLNVNGTGAKSVYNQIGIISASNTAMFAANQPIEFRYDGTGWVFVDVAKAFTDTNSAITGAARNLKGSATGTSTSVSYTMDEVVVKNNSNQYLTLRDLSLTWTSAGVGVANGIDTGSITANTWYYVHVIHNPTTSATALLISLSATAPTLPSGYTYFARVGEIRWGTSYPLKFVQAGNKIEYSPAAGTNVTEFPTMASGALGTWTSATYTPVAVSLSSFVPPTAVEIDFFGWNGGGGVAMAASMDNTGGGWASATTPPFQNLVSGSAALVMNYSGLLRSQNIYVATAASGPVFKVKGWRTNI